MDEQNLNNENVNVSDDINNVNTENQPIINNNEAINTTDQEVDDELDSNIVTLKDETGNDVNFEFLDLIEYEGENYVILLPADEVESEESDEVVILKEDKNAVDVEEGQESYVSVDDEDVLNKVFDIFKEKFKDEFNFVEDDNN